MQEDRISLPTIRFQEEMIEVTTNKGTMQVTRMVAHQQETGAATGLAYYHSSAVKSEFDGYVLTHVPSGLRLDQGAVTPYKSIIQRWVQLIVSITDWTRSASSLVEQYDKTLIARIDAAFEQAEREWAASSEHTR